MYTQQPTHPFPGVLGRLLVAFSFCFPLLSSADEAASINAPAAATVATPPPADAGSLQAILVRALQNNPEVRLKTHQVNSSAANSDVVYGDQLPRVDLRSSVGRENSNFQNSPDLRYTAKTVGIEARQLIFNGFSSQAAYEREVLTAQSKLFELEETANNVAADVARAYLNVVRYKTLVKLAEDNYQRHQTTLMQIQRKVEAGVGRRSDLDQTVSRLSLALSNVTAERNNLYAALTQYQRVTSQAWGADQTGTLDLDIQTQGDTGGMLKAALESHPSIRAAGARVATSAAEMRVASAGFYPRVDLRARSDRYSNYLATNESRQISAIELLAQVNLYRGGSDSAQQKVAAAQKLQQMEDKVRVCNNVRQSLLAAVYDNTSNDKKIDYLQAQRSSISKARQAYIQQFDVGQKNLLDLLDADNELFQAERAIVNAQADRSIARATLLASVGSLLSDMGVTQIQQVSLPERRTLILAPSNIGIEASDLACPADSFEYQENPLPDAAQLASLSSRLAASSLLAPQNQTASEAIEGLPGLPSSPDTTANDDTSKQPGLLTQQWAQYWAGKDVKNYLAMYSSHFKPDGLPFDSWKAQRRSRLSEPKLINVTLTDIQVTPNPNNSKEVEVRFTQKYRSDAYRDVTNKSLLWIQEEDGWKIVRERTIPAGMSPYKKPGGSART